MDAMFRGSEKLVDLFNLFQCTDIQRVNNEDILFYRLPDEEEGEDFVLEIEWGDNDYASFTKEQVKNTVEISPGKFEIIGDDDNSYILAFYTITPYSG